MRDQTLYSRRSVAAVLPITAVVGTSAAAFASSSVLKGDAKLLEFGRHWDAIQAKRRANDAVFAAMS